MHSPHALDVRGNPILGIRQGVMIFENYICEALRSLKSNVISLRHI